MKTIYKYPIKITGEQEIMMPTGFQVTMVGLDPSGTPCIWAIVNPENSVAKETICIFGTGHPLHPVMANKHIGSFVEGSYVWHVFLK